MFDDIRNTVKELAVVVKSVKKELSEHKALIKKLETRLDTITTLMKRSKK